MPEEEIREERKMSEEVKAQIVRDVVKDIREDVREDLKPKVVKEIAQQLERIRPAMEDRISASTSEALNALNYRLAQHGKKIDDLTDVVLKREEAPPEEKPSEEPPEEKPPEEEPAEEPEEKPEEPSEELEPIVGHCAHCSLGFTQEDKDANFRRCPECGNPIEWD